MNILFVTCSTRGASSESHRLAHEVLGHLLARDPGAMVTERDLGSAGIPHIDANYALAQHSSTAPIEDAGAIVRSDALIQELEQADVVVIGTPMHNLAMPSVLKAWIDHIVRARRTFTIGPKGKVGTLRDRPVFVAIASGGRFSGERARQPDFLTPWLTAILGMIGLHDLTFFSVQGTGLGADALEDAWLNARAAMGDRFAIPVRAASR